MRKRAYVLTLCGVLAVLLSGYVPAGGLFLSAGGPVAVAGGMPPPSSSIAALPEWSPAQFWVNYTVNGSHGQSGVFWTELWYQSRSTPAWTLYAPPWNPSGKWKGTPSTGHREQQTGSILFDSYLTGGEGRYNFTTVAVDRGFRCEDRGCGRDADCLQKAHTTVDTTPPVLFVARPTPGSWTNSDVLQWIATDQGSGVASVAVSVDGGAPQVTSEANGSMNLSLATQGVHDARVTVRDFAGNAFRVDIPFHYDTQAPDLAITSPGPNAWLNATTVDLTWTASDPAGIASLSLSTDSGPAVALASTTTSYELEGLAQAPHVVTLIAVDPAGNLASQTLAFGVDTTPPGLQIVTPVAGTWSNSHQIQAIWMSSDSGSGIDRYTVSLDGAAPISLTNSAGYIFPNVTEGPHTVRVTAVDRAGNVATASSTVSVDYTPPSIILTAPVPGTTVYGTPSVNWSATDTGSGVARVVVTVDGTSEPAAVGQRTMALPSGLAIGPHAVTVQVWDQAGNMNESTVAFAYGGLAPPAPTESGLPPTDFWWVLAGILAIAMGSAYIAVRRRRRPRT